MRLPFAPADFALIGVVTAMATAMAYVHSPRAKSLIFCLPLPFTAGVIASGQPVGITHVVGVALVAAFPWLVWLLHTRWGLNIVLADLITVGAVLGTGFLLARLLPAEGTAEAPAFWAATALLGVLAAALIALPPRSEPGHRSSLPVYFKVPAVAAVVLGIVLVKGPLRGFMPTFPFATIFAVYESRRSLYTLAWRMPIMTLGFVPMLIACRLLLPGHGYAVALACGWAGFVPLALLLDRYYARRAVDEVDTVDGVDVVEAVDKSG